MKKYIKDFFNPFIFVFKKRNLGDLVNEELNRDLQQRSEMNGQRCRNEATLKSWQTMFFKLLNITVLRNVSLLL